MMGEHLFDFNIKGGRYVLPLEHLGGWDGPTEDMGKVSIRKLFTGVGDFGEMWYDFGDDWHVGVWLEIVKLDEVIPEKELPRIIEGKGFGIVEDCGGAWSLSNIAKCIKNKNKNNEEWEERKEWIEEMCPEVLEVGMDNCDITLLNIDLKCTKTYRNRRY